MPTSIIDRAIVDLKREFPKIDVSTKGIVYSFFYLADHFSSTGGRVLEEFGLSWGEYLVISTVRRRGVHGSMSPSSISASVRMSTGGLSNLLRRLEKSGLVKRTPSKRDGRGVFVTLTARGRKLAEDALLAISANQVAHVESLPKAERARLSATLRALVAHFESRSVSLSLLGGTR